MRAFVQRVSVMCFLALAVMGCKQNKGGVKRP